MSLSITAENPTLSWPPRFRISEAPLSLTDPRVGATLDGTGDESAKVATAIGLLPAAGGQIYHPPGILRTGAIATGAKAVDWLGAGESVSQIKAAAGFAGTLVTVESEFSHFHNVTIDGGGSATAGLKVTRARCKFDHLHVNSMAGEGIWINGAAVPNSAHANQFSDIRVIDCIARGVLVQAFAYDTEFSNLWVGTCGTGVRVENTDAFFTNLHVWGSTGAGVELRGADSRLANVYIETCGTHGIDAFNAPRTRITGGKIWKNQSQGVNISSSDRCGMVNLAVYDNGQNGVNGANSLHGKVIGCDLYDDTGSAQTQDRPIVTTGTSDRWIIMGNTMLTADHATGASSLVGANNVVVDNVTT